MSDQVWPTSFAKQSRLLILLLLVTSLTWCAGRSGSSLPLAGIFGLSDNKDKEKQQKQQNEQRAPPNINQQHPSPQGGRGYPPPPQGGRGPPLHGRQGGPPSQQRRPPFMPPQRGNIPPQGHDPRRQPPQQSHQLHPPRSQFQPGQPQRPPPPPPIPGRDTSTEPSSSSPLTSETTHEEDADAAVSLEAIEKELAALKNETEALLVATQEEIVEEVANEEEINNANSVLPEDATEASPNLQSQWTNEASQSQQPDKLPHPPQGWMGQPPPSNFQNGGWGMQTQQAQPPPEYQQGWDQQPYDGGMYGYQSDLDMSLAREHDLIMQLQNLTDMTASMQQREDLHIRQLDVLTERVMDVEAQAANDRNLVVEYEANCTALGMTIATLSDELEDWKQRCTELSELRDQDEERIAEFKKLIEEKSADAEELAVAIENVRLVERVKKGSSSGRRSQSKGMFGWIFSLFFGSGYSETEEMTREVSSCHVSEIVFVVEIYGMLI